MNKFKVGDTVRVKKDLIKWYLSDEGQDCFFPPSGVMNESQEKTHKAATVAMLSMAMDNSITGVITDHHHPFTEMENFRVEVLDAQFNISPDDLIKVRSGDSYKHAIDSIRYMCHSFSFDSDEDLYGR